MQCGINKTATFLEQIVRSAPDGPFPAARQNNFATSNRCGVTSEGAKDCVFPS